jgi:hypothetical protein
VREKKRPAYKRGFSMQAPTDVIWTLPGSRVRGEQRGRHIEPEGVLFCVIFARNENDDLPENTYSSRLAGGMLVVVYYLEFVMAPRAYWKGYLKLSLVSCPIALFPATSEREKISFHQLNKKTGNRIKYRKVDAESGDEVDSADVDLKKSTHPPPPDRHPLPSPPR